MNVSLFVKQSKTQAPNLFSF